MTEPEPVDAKLVVKRFLWACERAEQRVLSNTSLVEAEFQLHQLQDTYDAVIGLNGSVPASTAAIRALGLEQRFRDMQNRLLAIVWVKTPEPGRVNPG